MKTILMLALFLLPVFDGWAKKAIPMAADPVLEERVNVLANELRCLVCQNQTIADSDAALAIDLKQQVREMLAEGKSNEEVIDYMVVRYGDFVRYRPPMNSKTFLLWFGPFILLIGGGLFVFVNIKKRRAINEAPPLSTVESEQLNQILKDHEGDKV